MTRMLAGVKPRMSQYLAYCLSITILGAQCGYAQAAPLAQSQSTPQSQGSQAQPEAPAVQQGASSTPPQKPTMATPVIPADPTEPKQNAQPAKQSPAPDTPPPVGTAVSPVVRSDGIPASRPAGAAIAPSRQRRKHSVALRVGLIVGAAVAVGIVTAASLSSSSRPK
jgi:hypothetical protein